jgi:GntR family transcriptional regulator
MDVVVSTACDLPLYQQIYEQISSQIIRGQLESGYALPPIRTVAKDLRISVITVKRAWEELESKGFIHTMVGKGCFVAPLPTKELDRKRDGLVLDRLRKDLEYYRSLGLSKEDVVELVEKHYNP